jgi:hypothetical protein
MDARKAVKDASTQLQDYINDLNAWEDEIRKRDQYLRQLPKPTPQVKTFNSRIFINVNIEFAS